MARLVGQGRCRALEKREASPKREMSGASGIRCLGGGPGDGAYTVEEQNDNSFPLFLNLCCWLFGFLGLLAVSIFGWALKDGLGPDAVESHGWLAFARFLSEAGWQLLPPAALVVAGCLLYRWDGRRSTSKA
jgi:hypothetical protein